MEYFYLFSNIVLNLYIKWGLMRHTNAHPLTNNNTISIATTISITATFTNHNGSNIMPSVNISL